MIGQSPYNTTCPVTRHNYSSGIALIPHHACKTIPKSAEIVLDELREEFGISRRNIDVFKSWIDQGVFLTNVALTTCTNSDPFLENHIILWKEFTVLLVEYLSSHLDNMVIVLMGKEAWDLETSVKIGGGRVRFIKVGHPVARAIGKVPFKGSNVFKQVNDILVHEFDQFPIDWT